MAKKKGKYYTGSKALSKLAGVSSGRVSGKYVTMELFDRLKAELKALKKKLK